MSKLANDTKLSMFWTKSDSHSHWRFHVLAFLLPVLMIDKVLSCTAPYVLQTLASGG